MGKEKILRDWKKFIEANFDKAKFTKRLYNHIIQHCSFIVHFNQGRFFCSNFEDPEDTIRFLKQFDTDSVCVFVEYGSTQ